MTQMADLIKNSKKAKLNIETVTSKLDIDIDEVASFHGMLALETRMINSSRKNIESLAISLQVGIILGYYYALKEFSDTKTEKI